MVATHVIIFFCMFYISSTFFVEYNAQEHVYIYVFCSLVVHLRNIMNSFYPCLFRINSKLYGVYFNKWYSSPVYQVNVNVMLFDLKYQLDQTNLCLNHHDMRMVTSIGYYCFPVDEDVHVYFTNM